MYVSYRSFNSCFKHNYGFYLYDITGGWPITVHNVICMHLLIHKYKVVSLHTAAKQSSIGEKEKLICTAVVGKLHQCDFFFSFDQSTGTFKEQIHILLHIDKIW